MIPYVLAENPNITKKAEAFELSKEMMDGHKMEVFKVRYKFNWMENIRGIYL